MRYESAAVCEQEVEDKLLQCLGAGKKSAQVEHAPIGAEPYVDTLVQVFFGFPEHHAEEHCEQSRRQHTALLYAVLDGERVGELAVVLHLSLLANVACCCRMERNRGRHPSLPRILHRPSLLTVSNAFVRSMKAAYRAIFCSMHFSWI